MLIIQDDEVTVGVMLDHPMAKAGTIPLTTSSLQAVAKDCCEVW
jgi:hypothetical protein